MIMKLLKEKISITIDSDLLELLRQEAEKDDRSLSQYISVALKEHIRNNSLSKKTRLPLYNRNNMYSVH